MRILLAVHGYPPTHCAGAERQAERMAQWLIRHGHGVEVFAIESATATELRLATSQQDGLTVHRLSYNVKEGPDSFQNLYDHPAVGEALRRVLSRAPFDLMHVMSGYLLGVQAVDSAHEFKLPVVLTLTEYWFMCKQLNLVQPTGRLCSGPESDLKCARCILEEKRRFRWPAQVVPKVMDRFWRIEKWRPSIQRTLRLVEYRRLALRSALDATELVICLSRFIASKFAEFQFDTSSYRFIRLGLAKPPGNARPAQRQSDRSLRLGYLGQIKPHKGVDLVVAAVLNLLRDGHKATLDLWGSETEDPGYVAMLKNRSGSRQEIRWNGRFTAGRVWEILSALDVLVVPSRWYENSPAVILESFAMRVPVVCTELGGMAELVTNGHDGLTFRLNDADDLYQQLRRLLSEQDLLDRLRANTPPSRTIDEEMAEIVDAYRELVGCRRRTFTESADPSAYAENKL